MISVTVEQVVQTTAILLVLGAVMVSSLLLVPGKRDAARDTFQAMLSMLLVAGTMLVVFAGGAYTLVPFFVLLAIRTGYEATIIQSDKNTALRLSVASGVLTALALLVPLLGIAFVGLWLVIVGRSVTVPNKSRTRLWQLVELLLFPMLPVAILAAAALDPALRPVVLIIYVLVELFDSCAYAAGKFLGKTPAFPILSPRKTIEGLFGGAVCLALVVAGVALWAGLPVGSSIVLACLSGAFGVAGDLAGSRLKRSAGVKDFPPVLKKQGGALDILDSWIAAGAAVSMILLGLNQL